jgi:HEAT repeat protein
MNTKALLSTLSLCAFALAAFAGVEQTVNDLLPKLAADTVRDRYSAQMELQNLALSAGRPGVEAERAELATILAAKAADATVPQPARVWVVRQLEYIGAAESVTALTSLLNGQDGELKECARRALEKNPAPAATEVLRAALKQGGEPAWIIGLIQSLGGRRDSGAVELIKPHLSNRETARAACSALAKIADPQALAALWGAYDEGIAGAADALVAAGNRLVSAGDKVAAKDLFNRLYLAGTTGSGATPQAAKQPIAPVQVRSVALVGLAAADPASARSFIDEALQQQEPALQFAAVTAAEAAHGKAGVTAALVPLLPKLSPNAKVFVLRALDASAEAQIIAAAGDPDEAVRIAALEALSRVGSAASAAILVKAAAENASGTQKAAAAALARISGPGADAAIAKAASDGDAKTRVVAINALAQRNDQSASSALLQYAADADPAVSTAACAALGKIGTDKELEGLIQLVLTQKTSGAVSALQAVASRATDKAAAAQKLIALTKTAEPQQLASLYEILAVLGGKEALTATSIAAGSNNEQVKDAAIRALANWPDFSATTPLLVIALDPHVTRVHNVLAVQGIARLVKSSDKEPAAIRLKTAIAAIHAAARDEDKKLLLSALASVPDKAAGDAIIPFLSMPKYQQEAGLAGITLAETLRRTDRPAARDLAQAIKNANLSEDLTRRADAILTRTSGPARGQGR